MEEDGIQLLQNVRTTQVKNEGDEVVVVTEDGNSALTPCSVTGRKPNVEPTAVTEKYWISELTERGAIQGQQALGNICTQHFAAGDVMAVCSSYISLDDFRILYSYLAGDGSYTQRP